jgi:hypothetical protein
MDILKLDITPDGALEMLEYFIFKKKNLEDEYRKVFDKLEEYNTMIIKLQDILASRSKKDYPLGGSWNQKIHFFLLDDGIGLTARQITQKIINIEGLEHEEEKKIYSSVAPTLSAGFTTGIYERYPNERNEYVYNIKE